MVWGFKLHAVVNLGGLFQRWALVRAHEHDRASAEALVQGPTLGDKAYVGSGVYCLSRRKEYEAADPLAQTPIAATQTHRDQLQYPGAKPHPSRGAGHGLLVFAGGVNLKIAAHNLIHSGVLA